MNAAFVQLQRSSSDMSADPCSKAAPLACPRVTAMPPRTAATRPRSRPRGNKTKDTAATRLVVFRSAQALASDQQISPHPEEPPHAARTLDQPPGTPGRPALRAAPGHRLVADHRGGAGAGRGAVRGGGLAPVRRPGHAGLDEPGSLLRPAGGD